MDTYMNEFDFLREQAVSEDLIKEILEFRKEYTVAADAVGRVQQPAIHCNSGICTFNRGKRFLWNTPEVYAALSQTLRGRKVRKKP